MDWETNRISKYLNSNNFKTFSGLEWVPKLVKINRKK